MITQLTAKRGAQPALDAHRAPLTLYWVFWLFLIAGVAGDLVEIVFWLVTRGELTSRSSLIYGQFSIVWGAGAVLLTLVFHRCGCGRRVPRCTASWPGFPRSGAGGSPREPPPSWCSAPPSPPPPWAAWTAAGRESPPWGPSAASWTPPSPTTFSTPATPIWAYSARSGGTIRRAKPSPPVGEGFFPP